MALAITLLLTLALFAAALVIAVVLITRLVQTVVTETVQQVVGSISVSVDHVVRGVAKAITPVPIGDLPEPLAESPFEQEPVWAEWVATGSDGSPDPTDADEPDPAWFDRERAVSVDPGFSPLPGDHAGENFA